jgi:hypothetical protein
MVLDHLFPFGQVALALLNRVVDLLILQVAMEDRLIL